MHLLVILVPFFLFYFAGVEATFYFELLTSDVGNSRCANFRINRSYGEKRFFFLLYQCDTSERNPQTDAVKAKCVQVYDPMQKQAIYTVINFYDVTDLEFIPGDTMRVDGYNMVDVSDIITVGFDPKNYDRPIFMPVSNSQRVVEEKTYKHLARFVKNQRDRPFVNKLLRFCSVNNVEFFFFYAFTNMELFEVYESIMVEMIAESGLKKEKEFWQVLSSKFSSRAESLKKSVSSTMSKTCSRTGSVDRKSWREAEERAKSFDNFLTRAQHLTLGASVCRFMTWTLARRLPPEEKLEVPPEEESEEEPEPELEEESEEESEVENAEECEDEDEIQAKDLQPVQSLPSQGRSPNQSQQRDRSLSQPSAKKPESLAETNSMRLARIQAEREANYKKWAASSLKSRALPEKGSLFWAQPQAQEPEPVNENNVTYQEEEQLGKHMKPVPYLKPQDITPPSIEARIRSWSQTLANESEPMDEIDAQYHEDELLGKYIKPVPSLLPEDMYQNPSKLHPFAWSQHRANQSKPINETNARYAEDEMQGATTDPISSLQPRAMNPPRTVAPPPRVKALQPAANQPPVLQHPPAGSQQLTRERTLGHSLPLAKEQTNPQFAVRHELMKSAGYIVFKMFDPCYILKATDEEKEKAEQICSLNCRMFSMAQQVYGVTFNPHCKHLRTGECKKGLCICLPRCSFWSKSVGMIFCANALRLHVFEHVVKYKIRH